MIRPMRTRRALLFVPGTEAEKIAKAARAGADGVIIDLEDAAALSRKAEARAIALRALREVDFGACERCVRVNPVGSGLERDDLAALEPSPPDCVMLPKVESEGDVRWLDAALQSIERAREIPYGTIRVIALIESARGVAALGAIAGACERVDALAFGAEDLCGDLGATRTAAGDEVMVARGLFVIHAAAHRLQAIDTPYVDLGNVAGLADDTRRALGMGFTGRLAVHPRQVEPIKAVFTPSSEELAQARRLIAEHDRHQAAGRGVFELDGRMVDMPMIRAAQRVLARARNAGLC